MAVAVKVYPIPEKDVEEVCNWRDNCGAFQAWKVQKNDLTFKTCDACLTLAIYYLANGAR